MSVCGTLYWRAETNLTRMAVFMCRGTLGSSRPLTNSFSPNLMIREEIKSSC